MKRSAIIITLLGAGMTFGLACPRTLEWADLVVVGKATTVAAFPAERQVRVDVKEVLWPPSATNMTQVVFSYYAEEGWYTNMPGVFFLRRGMGRAEAAWVRVGSEWMTPLTNALSVLLEVEKVKGSVAASPLPAPKFVYPKDTPYDSSQSLRLAYLASFSDGYNDTLAGGSRGLPIFAPTNALDKAKVLGYAHGQVFADSVRKEWLRKLNDLMR